MRPTRGTAGAQGQGSEQPEDFQAYVPIENLVIAVPHLQVGSAQLYPMTPDKREDLFGAIAECVDGTIHSPEERAEMRDSVDKMILPYFDDCACLQFGLRCGPSAVRALATARAEEILSLIRLYTAAFYPPEARARVNTVHLSIEVCYTPLWRG